MTWLVVIIGLNAGPALAAAAHIHDQGSGYTSRAWHNSEAMAYVKALPIGTTIYSNGVDVIHFLSDRTAVALPNMFFAKTLAPNPQALPEISAMRNDVLENGAVIVYFSAIDWRTYYPTQKELQTNYAIPVLLRLHDGTIYAVNNARSTPQ